MIEMQLRTQLGINPEHKEEAARLYAIAFETKFKNILGKPEEVTQLLKEGINHQMAISVISDENELLGIAGFHLDKTSFIDLQLKDFVQQYGIVKGLYKSLLMAILFYRKPDNKGQLLMDGIAVKVGFRGRGIGKKLLTELEQFARDKNRSSIKLDVIDENPHAKRLYENMGFISIKYRKTPRFIYKLMGVSGVTTMVKYIG